jgi:hypothetical protein
METWWSSLGTALQVFYAIALASSLLLVLQLVLTLFGLDGDADVDTHDTGLSFLSMRSVTAFFTGFGWGGVIAVKQGLGLWPSIGVALAIGGALMAAVVALMRAVYSLRYSGTLDYRNAVGAVGNVYLPIPGAMAGPGQVEVLVQGRLCVVQAFTRAPDRIPNQARVRVVDVVDPQTLLVEPVAAAATAPATPAAGGAGAPQEV